MERHTLKDFIGIYEPKYIQLMFGWHLINIDTMAKGSYAIIRRFKNDTFEYVSCNKDLLVLKY